MELVQNFEQLLENIENVEYYLTRGSVDERIEISKYIKRGTCFVAYNIDKEYRFAPSKFLGYRSNTLANHQPSRTDGRDTNKAIGKIIGTNPYPNEQLELKYARYCENIGSPANRTGGYGAIRKFWPLALDTDFKENYSVSGEFPERKIVERIHKSRERNIQVVQLAKAIFKKMYDRLFCQACGFNFQDKYGKIGDDFIEAHHVIAVSEMRPGHKTKPEDIALLCANCHRMVHKKRPWLSMANLKSLISK